MILRTALSIILFHMIENKIERGWFCGYFRDKKQPKLRPWLLIDSGHPSCSCRAYELYIWINCIRCNKIADVHFVHTNCAKRDLIMIKSNIPIKNSSLKQKVNKNYYAVKYVLETHWTISFFWMIESIERQLAFKNHQVKGCR